MISLDFDTNEKQNVVDVHKWDNNIVLVAHNGYSYVRVVIPVEEISTLITKLDNILDEPLKNLRDEAKSV